MPFVLAIEISHLALLSHLFRGAFFFLIYFTFLFGFKLAVQVTRWVSWWTYACRRSCSKKPSRRTNGIQLPLRLQVFVFLKKKSLFSFLVQALLVDIGAVKSKKEAKELVCQFVKRESTSDVTRRIDSNMTRTAFSQS